MWDFCLSLGFAASLLLMNTVTQGTAVSDADHSLTAVNWHKGGTKLNTSEFPAWNLVPGEDSLCC